MPTTYGFIPWTVLARVLGPRMSPNHADVYGLVTQAWSQTPWISYGFGFEYLEHTGRLLVLFTTCGLQPLSARWRWSALPCPRVAFALYGETQQARSAHDRRTNQGSWDQQTMCGCGCPASRSPHLSPCGADSVAGKPGSARAPNLEPHVGTRRCYSRSVYVLLWALR